MLDDDSEEARRRTAIACESCHIAKVSCGAERPCKRCLRLGIQTTCSDRAHKKRGRPKKQSEEDDTESPQKFSKSIGVDEIIWTDVTQSDYIEMVSKTFIQVFTKTNWVVEDYQKEFEKSACMFYTLLYGVVDIKAYWVEAIKHLPEFVKNLNNKVAWFIMQSVGANEISNEPLEKHLIKVDAMDFWSAAYLQFTFDASESSSVDFHGKKVVRLYKNSEVDRLTKAFNESQNMRSFCSKFCLPADYSAFINYCVNSLTRKNRAIYRARYLNADGHVASAAVQVTLIPTPSNRNSISFSIMPAPPVDDIF